MPVIDLPKPQYSRNMRLIGWSDQGGRLDGVQIMVHHGYAYIGHMFSKGFSVVDVRDPARPRPAGYFAAPPNTWNIHLQAHDDLLLVINAKDMFAEPAFADEHAYYKGTIGHTVGTAHGSAGKRDWTAGLAIYDIKTPSAPRQIGFLPVEGGGIHRAWYVGGRWAYASALLDGFSDYILITIDLADPTHPREGGRFWLPGMNLAAGETPTWSPTTRMGLHHAIVHDGTAYAAWRDGCLVVIDVSDPTRPKMITHKSWAPPFGGGTHNCLPLPDRDLLIVVDEAVLDHQEDGMKPIWIFDNRVPANPISIATLPNPQEADYKAVGGHFGPHNIYENRPEGFVSSDLIFATYQNAGVRVFDIRDQYHPTEIAALVPAMPEKMMDTRPNRARVIQSADVFVDRNRIVYATDYNGGLSIMEYTG